MEAAGAVAPTVRAETHPRLLRAGRWALHQVLNVYTALALLYLLLPIAIVLLFSFNDTHSRFNFVWQGFTLKHWQQPFAFTDLTDAFVTSIQIAVLSTIIATALGTLMALALVRYEFRGRGPVNLFIFLPLATPEVVLGASLLSLFVSIGFTRGFTSILIAHVMFNVSFVVVTVRSRLIGFDRALEEAAQDLGANSLQTFLRVTLPLIMPGVIAGALLAFSLSIDDFVVTNFNAGSTVTYPLFIWGAAARGVPPQVNVLAAMIFVFTVAVMLLTVWQQRRAERMASVRPEPEPAA
jgi:spermidine/putrescine transport system permease protein